MPALRRLPDDLRGLASLATDATVGAADLVEAVHAQFALRRSTRQTGRRRGISGLVYRSIRRLARLSGWGAEAALLPLARLVREARDTPSSNRREALVAALNGVLGDGLDATGNPLAIPMRFRRDGSVLDLTPEGLRAALPHATPDVLVLAHGLCMNDLEWATAGGHDHGAALERDAGVTAVYLHYNTGRHISTNGHAFADLLEQLVDAWPVPVRSLSLVCHSMGGLVARSAIAVAPPDAAWRRALRRVVFLGTPHHGSPAERAGNRIDRLLIRSRLTAPFAPLGHIRSAGITDLRYGLLLDADWRWRDRFAARADPRTPVPLPEDIDVYAVAATRASRTGTLADRLVGDGIVPVASASGHHADPRHALAFDAERVHVALGVNHFGLLGPDVYPILKQWFGAHNPKAVDDGRSGA
ncbi:MAG TPA: hypothetical protein VF594_04040 [Rubricoccaceae bacterium]|jgi:hypothetical protein